MNIQLKLPRPHKKQQEVLNSKARFKVICSGRRSGKSVVCKSIAIKKMVDGQKVAYVTPTFDLSKDFFRDIVNLIPAQVIKTVNKSELYIELITGGSIRFLSGEALENFRGKAFHYLIIDEAAFISDLENAWYTSIRATLTDYEGGAIFISTPNGKNFFYSLFTKGVNKEDGYESFHFPTSDNPYISKDEIEEARKTLPEAKFRQEYLAVPGENEDNPFGIKYVYENTIDELFDTETIVYGIDVAKVNDWTVIVGLDKDGNQTYFERFKGPWENTYEAIRKLSPDVPKIIDSTGVGDVILERCQLGDVYNIEGYKFNNDSKTKIIYELIKDVEASVVKFNQVIADEMMVYEYKYSKTGLIQFNAQAGFNDDAITALALANHKRLEITTVSNWQMFSV